MDAMLRTFRFVAVALMAVVTWAISQPAVAGSLKDEPAQPPERGVWFSGVDLVKDSRYYYDGIIVALNGDLGRDGFFVRAYGSLDNFDRNPGDGRQWQGDVALGYMFSRNKIDFDIYAGVDYQNVRLRPDDPTAEVRGTEWDFKIGAGIETEKELPYYFRLEGNYSTAFNSYWARARVGLRRDRFTFGPEASVVGDEDFDAQRVGGFVMFDLQLPRFRPVEVTVSAGHQFVSGGENGGATGGIGGSSGTYGLVNLSVSF
jgi:Cellulose biosynthesis protein BcsS